MPRKKLRYDPACDCGRCQRRRALALAEAEKVRRAQIRVNPHVTKSGAAAGRRYAVGWLRRAVLKRDKFRCRYCGVAVTDKTANMDHVIPWPEGMTEMKNLQTACRECNRKKGRKTIQEMRRRPRRKWGPSQWKGMRDDAPGENGNIRVRVMSEAEREAWA